MAVHVRVAALTAAVALSATAIAHADVPRWKVWLCQPGLKVNYCNTDLSVTVIPAKGAATVVNVPDTRNPPVDCFYVYPTVTRPGVCSKDGVRGCWSRAPARRVTEGQQRPEFSARTWDCTQPT